MGYARRGGRHYHWNVGFAIHRQVLHLVLRLQLLLEAAYDRAGGAARHSIQRCRRGVVAVLRRVLGGFERGRVLECVVGVAALVVGLG